MSLWDELPCLEAAARRELPAVDPAILALSEGDRAVVAELWAARARSELGAAAVFAAAARGLFAEGGGAVPHELLWLASRAVCDELRHAEICRYVASRYGVEPPRAAPPVITEPPFGRGIHAVLNSALNETIGSAFLSACLEEADGILVRAALRELLTDEMDHARLGWALLATPGLGGAMRSEVEGRLPELIHIVRGAWFARAVELPKEIPRGHGGLPREEVLRVVEIAIRDVILPGFEHLGIRARAR